MNQWPFVCCKESWDIKDDRSQGAEQRRRTDSEGNSLIISFSHTGLEKSTSWRTSAALTPLNIEQRDRMGGEGAAAQ